MSLPTNFTTTFIPGTACIGDSRETINNNFSTLLSAVSTTWNYIDDQITNVNNQQLLTVANYLSTTNIQVSGLTTTDTVNILSPAVNVSSSNISISSSNVFYNTATIANCVSALAIEINGTTLYLPLLSSYN